jgi:hypothetical protein
MSSVGIEYSRSNNVVYEDFVEYCLRKSKTFDIVCRPWAPNLALSEAPTPSWVCQVNKLPFGHGRNNIYGRKSGDVLVGECFVYGLMDGEAMDIKAFTDRTQEFLLR